MYANQRITNTVTTPSVTWFTDTPISPPLLTFPADAAKYCPPITPKISQNTGVYLKWDSVVGATFYILQLSLDSQQFSGPGLKSIRLTAVEYQLKYLDDVRIGQTVYWRVYAYNAVGGQSLSSSVRSFTLECPGFSGLDVNPEDPSSTISTFSCDAIGADIKIVGAATLRKGDTDRMYVVDIAYDCKDLGGNPVEITGAEWSIKQPDADSGSDPVVSIVSQTEQYVELETSSSLVNPHTFDLVVDVEFTITDTVTSAETVIECQGVKRVLVEGTGAGGSDFFWFTILDLDCSGQCASVRVDIPSCSTTVDAGDTITVYDPIGVFFNAHSSVLTGERGWASRATFTPVECTLDEDSGYPLGEACYWMVMDMICVNGGC